MPGQTPRRDSEDTRRRILEAACRIFAEKGVDRATGKEITEAAGVNVAAINYHFGGIAALYGEVLVMAHRRVVAQDALSGIAEGDADPVAKLRQLIDLAVGSVAEMSETGWALRLLGREFQDPSPQFQALSDSELVPKRRATRQIIAAVIGRPEDDPLVSRAVLSVLSPIDALLIGDPSVVRRSYPALLDERHGLQAIADHLFAFSLGGLFAISGSPELRDALMDLAQRPS
jgi:TetR/AcrR family transcriptional regulator, regulator of cefoperazone and chloramphenicol sensitivity